MNDLNTTSAEKVWRTEGHCIVFRDDRFVCLTCGAKLFTVMQFNLRECPRDRVIPPGQGSP